MISGCQDLEGFVDIKQQDPHVVLVKFCSIEFFTN